MIGVDEDSSADILLTGDDPDGDDLLFALVTKPLFGLLSGDSSVRQYTPEPDFFGPDSPCH